jgi:hypothetical protein
LTKIVAVPWETDMRRVAANDSSETWERLLSELDQSAAVDSFAVKITGRSRSLEISRRIESIIRRGYSIENAAESGDVLTLVPRPSGVLFLVSELTSVDSARSYGQSRHFRTYCVALDMSSESMQRLHSVATDEIWAPGDFMGSRGVTEFVVELIASRGIDVVHIVTSKSGVDMIPTLRYCYPGLRFIVEIGDGSAQGDVFVSYVSCRYGNIVDAFISPSTEVAQKLKELHVTSSKIWTRAETETDDLSFGMSFIEGLYGQLIVSSAT